MKRNPIAWELRRAWRQTINTAKQRIAARRKASRPRVKRRATNRAQPWCPNCQLFVVALCRNPNPEPCGGVCRGCCPGHNPPKPKPEGATT